MNNPNIVGDDFVPKTPENKISTQALVNNTRSKIDEITNPDLQDKAQNAINKASGEYYKATLECIQSSRDKCSDLKTSVETGSDIPDDGLNGGFSYTSSLKAA